MNREELIEKIKEQENIIKKEVKFLDSLKSKYQKYEIEDFKKQYLNNCYKYPRNYYDCPESEEDYWDIYYYVYGVLDDGYLKTICFQKDKHGKITIETRRENGHHFNKGVIKITKEEYKAEWNKIMDYINKLKFVSIDY